MASFTLEIQDADLKRQLGELIKRVGSPAQALNGIGEQIVERVKQRFDTSTAPDGSQWKTNAPVTLGVFAAGLSKSYKRKDGGLNKRGQAKLARKKPLIDTGELSRQTFFQVEADTLTIRQSPVYAAIHQFGGQAGRNRKVSIPARPSLPFRKDGSIYPKERALIIEALNIYLADE